MTEWRHGDMAAWAVSHGAPYAYSCVLENGRMLGETASHGSPGYEIKNFGALPAHPTAEKISRWLQPKKHPFVEAKFFLALLAN